jgi:lysophospholipase L1-like esterase
MAKIKGFLLLTAAASMLSACFDNNDDSGNGDELSYVAMGDALTAGFQNNGLVKTFQEQSYPALLAKQMGLVQFEMPLIDTPGIGRDKINGAPATPLVLEGGAIKPKPLGKDPQLLFINKTLDRPYDNLGVPGATTSDVLKAYDSTTSALKGNAFFNIILRGPILGNTTMLQQAILNKPDVITLWIGSSDILGGVVAGTIIPGVTVVPPAFYDSSLTKILDTLMAKTTARIFLANIPSITSIPFVTTVPRFVFNPATFQADTTTPLLTVEADVKYVLLPALGVLTTGTGIPVAKGGKGDSLAPQLTLTTTEAATAETIINGYNAIIAKKATDNPARITMIDVNGLLKKLTDGQIPGLSAKFVLLDPNHTAFGLDGIHPNANGYKEVANVFIDSINTVMKKSYNKVP